MTNIERMRRRKDALKKKYPIGTRVKLTELVNNEPHLPTGTMGTVIGYDDQPALLMNWDNGSGLSLLPFEGDKVEIISQNSKK